MKMSLRELFDVDKNRLLTVTNMLSYHEYLRWAIKRLDEVILNMTKSKDFYNQKQQEEFAYISKAMKHFETNLKELDAVESVVEPSWR